MKTCLFCANQRTFNIHGNYGAGYSILDDMLTFFGYQIEGHLKPDDAICHICMNVMDSVAKLKRRLLPLVCRFDDMPDCKPIELTKMWDALQSVEFDEEYFSSPSSPKEQLMKCNKIVLLKNKPQRVEYNGMEAVMARIAMDRRLSCYSSQSTDKEVAKISKKGRRRKRGHNWSKRKNGRYSSASVKSTGVTTRAAAQSARPPSAVSVESYESFYPPTSPVTVSHTPNLKVHHDLILPSSSIEINCSELHECAQPGCKYICEDIDLMAIHKQTKHKQLLLYFCNYCTKKFTENVDLNIHLRQHVKEFVCIICKREFYSSDELTSHWQEHYEKAVVCSYCQKRYKDELVLEKHKKKMHSRNIPSRIDYKINENGNNSKGWESVDFSVVMLVQGNKENIED